MTETKATQLARDGSGLTIAQAGGRLGAETIAAVTCVPTAMLIPMVHAWICVS